MGFFRGILNEVLSFSKIVVSNAMSSDKTFLTESEIDEAIKLSEVSLTDYYILERPLLLAGTNYALALNYYRKVSFFSNFNSKAIDRAIHHAHQAESSVTKEDFFFNWLQLQKILGQMYLIKSTGVRGEHYESSIKYVENWLAAINDPVEQAEAHFALMTAYASRSKGNKEENLQKSKKHYEKAIECNPDDPKWVSFINQMRGVSTFAAQRDAYDIPSGGETDSLSQIIEMMNGNGDWMKSGRFEPIELFTTLNNFVRLSSEISEGSAVPLSKLDESIENAIRFSEKLEETGEKNEKAEIDILVCSLYIFRAALCPEPADSIESFEKAEIYFERAWKHKTSFLNRPSVIFWQGKIFGTLLYFIPGKWAKAENLYRETLDALDTNYKASMGSLGKNVVLTQLSSHDLPLSLNYAFVLAKLKHSREAVVSLEKWRSRELNERLDRNNYMLEKVSSTDLERYRKIWDEITQIEAAMRGASEDDYVDSAKKLREKRVELEELISRIRAYLPDFLLESDFSMIQNAATPEKPLVYLLTTMQGGMALIVTSDGKVKSLFFEAFTKDKAETLFAELQSATEKSKRRNAAGLQAFSATLEKLGRYFTQSLIDELNNLAATSFCLIPCGILSQFPLHAAPNPEGKILLDLFDVSYAPTAKFLLDAQQKLRIEGRMLNPKPKKFVGIADPNNDLKHAAGEVKSIIYLLENLETEVVELAKSDATKEAVCNSLVSSDIVHFACHGEFNSLAPLDSALMLAQDNRLLLREILEEDVFQHLRQTRLVILSACQTALIDFNGKPEENIGLPLGFLSRGVPGVIGTLWSVDDESSALLLFKFYEIWLSDQSPDSISPAVALREAQTWLRRASKKDIIQSNSNILQNKRTSFNRDAKSQEQVLSDTSDLFKNPYFWAGFISIGA